MGHTGGGPGRRAWIVMELRVKIYRESNDVVAVEVEV